MSARNRAGCGGRPDCSGQITAVCTTLLFIATSFFMFYLLSGPPTFLEEIRMVGGDTVFYVPTWSSTWCECLQFDSHNNRSADDITLRSLALDHLPPLSHRFNYSFTQTIANPDDLFEYWEAIMHPGAKARAEFSFNYSVNVYFAPRFYVDGQDHDPDYDDHHALAILNISKGVIIAPPINVSDTWAFVFEKNFKLQTSTVGTVTYTYEMVEYEIPDTDPSHTGVGEGRFCWDSGNMNSSWFLNAKWQDGKVNVTQMLAAGLRCVPRYKLTIPIMCIPVVVFLVIEILIIVYCICKKPTGRYVKL